MVRRKPFCVRFASAVPFRMTIRLGNEGQHAVTFETVLLLGCAGALGAAARYAVVELAGRRWRGRFPVATLFINVAGAFALGVLLTAGTRGPAMPAVWRSVLGTGFLGGYTTFSTLSFETSSLVRRGHHVHAWANTLGTLLLGVTAAALGIAAGHLL